MASKVEIANRALSKIGDARILSFEDNNKQARAVNSAWDIVRDAELRRKRWSFSIKREALAAFATAPSFGYDNQFQLPTDCLRVISAGETYPGVDESNVRVGPDRAWVVEGRYLLANQDGPLYLRYQRRVEDTTLWDACFVQVVACSLAAEIADELSASLQRKESLKDDYRDWLRAAAQANAFELPPEDPDDDTWVTCRSR